MSIFNENRNKVQREPQSAFRGFHSIHLAEVEAKDKFRCDLRLLSGEKFKNVRTLGPYISQNGNAHGRAGGIRIGQLVAIGFVASMAENPIILAGLPFYAKQSDSNNYTTFFSSHPDFSTDDFEDFHISGYSVRYAASKISIVKENIPFVTIDLFTNQVTIGSGQIAVPNGNELLTLLTNLLSSLATLYTAIANTPTTAGDGGASFKAGLASAIATVALPEIPPTINQTNLKIGI